MLYRLSLFLLTSFVLITTSSVSSQVITTPPKLQLSPTLTLQNAGAWKSVQNGVEYRTMTLERTDASYSLELKLVRIDTRSVYPRIISSGQYDLRGSDVKNLAERSGAVAMINANYFDEKGRALGFLKVAAQEINRNVSKSSLFTGIFGVREHSPFIQHRDDFQATQAEEALQAGPLLLNRGAVLKITRGQGRNSRRALIGIDKDQRVVLGVTDAIFGGLAWGELQELFTNPKWQLETPYLLNLDGGGSAQLFIKTKHVEEFVAGTSDIPVAIGFFKKND